MFSDLRFALRQFRKAPGFTTVVVLTLAIGLGANTAIFGIVNATFLRALPYPEPEQLVRVFESSRQWPKMSVSYPNFLDWQKSQDVFSGLAIYRSNSLKLETPQGTDRATVGYVSGDFFNILGVHAALGRDLGPGTLLATGHTRDDQAETVLLHLERRMGRTRGGIRPRRADGVVRPLLPFGRAELRAFLAGEGVPYRDDASNADERFARNRVRHRVLPALEARWPGAAGRLARAAEALTVRLDALDARIDAALREAGIPLEGPWPRALLASLGREAAGRLLVRGAGEGTRRPGRAQVEKVLARLEAGDSPFREAFAGRRIAADRLTIRLTAPARLLA